MVAHHDESRNDAEADLRGNEPIPVNEALEQRIQKAEGGPKETGPKKRSDEATEQNRAPREHGEHGAIEEADEGRTSGVQNQCNDEGIPVKGIELGRIEAERFLKDDGAQKIDGVPDAAGFDEAVGAGENGHGHAAGPATFDAGRDWIRLQREPSADGLRGDGKTLDQGAFGADGNFLAHDGNDLFMLVGKDFTEPANGCDNGEYGAQNTERDAGEKSCEQQDNTEAEGKGPGGR